MRKTKYRNVKTNGYDSKKEANRATVLKLLEKQGKIQDLKEQVRFRFKYNDKLICAYVADFTYIEDGQYIVEDVKGYKTQMYKLKRKMMKIFFNIEIRET